MSERRLYRKYGTLRYTQGDRLVGLVSVLRQAQDNGKDSSFRLW